MKKQSSGRIYNRFKTSSKFRAKLILADEVAIKNISFSGILLETTKRMNINTTYRIQLVSSDNESITPKGMVVRESLSGQINIGINSLPLYSVAFKFVELDEREKRFLDKLLSEIADNTILTQEYMNTLQAGDADENK